MNFDEYRQQANQAFLASRDMDGSLQLRLDTLAQSLRALNPDMSEATDRMVARLKAGAAGESAPQVGEMMPDFVLPNEAGAIVTLSGLLERGPVGIVFHRGHWCPFCRVSMSTLVQAYTRASVKDAQIVAIVPERQEYAAAFKQDTAAPFPVLTDLDNAYALECNV